jgi:hypothetical protein
MKHHPMLKLFIFLVLVLCASSASSQSLPQDGQAQSPNALRVHWRFDTGG